MHAAEYLCGIRWLIKPSVCSASQVCIRIYKYGYQSTRHLVNSSYICDYMNVNDAYQIIADWKIHKL